jgi:hypothetical protein
MDQAVHRGEEQVVPVKFYLEVHQLQLVFN